MTSTTPGAEIVELTYRYAAGIDRRDWPMLRSTLADVCEVDFSSWSGVPAERLYADAWVAAMRDVAGRFDATQHLMTNHVIDVVDASNATCVLELQAQHWFAADSMATMGRPAQAAWCQLGGHLELRCERTDDSGWKIAGCRLVVRWRTGDESVFALARRR